MKETYYDILDIPFYATKDEIKQAYRSKIKKYHPDTYLGDKTFAEKMTRDLNEAYRILSDEKLKEQYDLSFKVSSSQEKTNEDNKQTSQTDFVDTAKQSVKNFFTGIKKTFKDGFSTLKQRVNSRREKRLKKKQNCVDQKIKENKEVNEIPSNERDRKKLTIIITILTLLLFVLIMIGLIV